jgi:transcriptional regulator with XRE-family HTH domain
LKAERLMLGLERQAVADKITERWGNYTAGSLNNVEIGKTDVTPELFAHLAGVYQMSPESRERLIETYCITLPKDTFGGRIQFERWRCGHSQIDAANIVGLDKNYYGECEQGHIPQAEGFSKLARGVYKMLSESGLSTEYPGELEWMLGMARRAFAKEPETLGKDFKIWRFARGRSLKEVAVKIGVRPPSLSDFEKGAGSLDEGVMIKLRNELQIIEQPKLPIAVPANLKKHSKDPEAFISSNAAESRPVIGRFTAMLQGTMDASRNSGIA